MSLFRNVTAFVYADDAPTVDLVALEAAAAERPARSPEPSQGHTIGFAPALWSKDQNRVHVAEGGTLAMVTIRIEEKKVPGAVWDEETDRRVEEFQKAEGKYPTKDERDALKGDAFRHLLARAFPRKKVVRVLFVQDQRLVLVGSASKDDVDSVTSLLREALGTFKVRPLRNSGETEAALTLWVKNGAPHDRETGTGFFLGHAATMSREAIRGEGPAPVAAVKNSDLDRDDVQQHIRCGKRVHKLAFACRLSDEFVVFGSVDKDFVLRSLNAQASQEAREAIDGGDEAAYYAGLFLLEARPLAVMVGLLRVHLVGDVDEQAGDLFEGETEDETATV